MNLSKLYIPLEQTLPIITLNDHIPLLFTFNIIEPTTWKRIIHDNTEIAQKLEATLKNPNNLNEELHQLNEYIKSQAFMPFLSKGFKENQTIRQLKIDLNRLFDKRDNSEVLLSQVENEITITKEHLKNEYNKEFTEYKKKFINKINSTNSKELYRFDSHLKYEEINWNTSSITKEGTLEYFKDKFQTKIGENERIKFKSPESTIKQGPSEISINKQDVIDALKRMKSETSGPDYITKNIFQSIDPEILASSFNNMLTNQNIPNE